ncbi:MAG: DUF2249 domain-containing protein [Allorhizobium sp.]
MTDIAETRPHIDVRLIPPPERHPRIFAMLNALPQGAAMLITSDHDPRPLQYHLQANFSGLFGWEYLEQGPEVWRVAIERLKQAAASGSGCGCGCGGAH